MQPYRRKAHYYETDQMGIIHHSNYIRWFEEARVDLMEQAGYGYARMEQEGVASPVLAISCAYKSMVHFDDTVAIHAKLRVFTGTRMELSYEVTDEKTGTVCVTGRSKHCFLSAEGRPVSLKKHAPEIYRIFSGLVEPEE